MIKDAITIRNTKMAFRGLAVAGALLSSTAHASGGLGLLWQNASTGVLSAWMLSGATVTGTQTLSEPCGPANKCSPPWNTVQTSGNTILWDNRTAGSVGAGQLGYWTFDTYGNVTVEPSLAHTCLPGAGCGTASDRPIGYVTLNLPSSDCPGGQSLTPCTYQGILWVDPGNDGVVVWNMSNQRLGATAPGDSSSIDVPLTYSFGSDAGTALPGQAVLTADFNGDGNTDILWFNQATGLVSVSLLSGNVVSERNFGLLGTQDLSWLCPAASCSSQWTIVGAADVNGDGHVDLTWFNATTGQVSSWLLDGKGNVMGTQLLSRTCSTAQGCAPPSRVLGYVNFPSVIQ
jgi:hypothetical protein